LDENGIIRVGAKIKEGDILIGKITPKGETDPTPEEKLLRAIFGDKAGDVKDASYKAPPSTEGIVVTTKLFQKAKKDKNSKVREKSELEKAEKVHLLNLEEIKKVLVAKLMQLVGGKTTSGIKNIFGEEAVPKGTKFS
jgi:DNA-directed RNA polymerase subunit beta